MGENPSAKARPAETRRSSRSCVAEMVAMRQAVAAQDQAVVNEVAPDRSQRARRSIGGHCLPRWRGGGRWCRRRGRREHAPGTARSGGGDAVLQLRQPRSDSASTDQHSASMLGEPQRRLRRAEDGRAGQVSSVGRFGVLAARRPGGRGAEATGVFGNSVEKIGVAGPPPSMWCFRAIADGHRRDQRNPGNRLSFLIPDNSVRLPEQQERPRRLGSSMNTSGVGGRGLDGVRGGGRDTAYPRG